jgi:hypothetical protein
MHKFAGPLAHGRVRSSLLSCSTSLSFFLASSFFLPPLPFFDTRGAGPRTPSSARGPVGEPSLRSRRLSVALRADFSDFWSHGRGIKKTCFFTFGQNTTNPRINRPLVGFGSNFAQFWWILGAILASIFHHFCELLKTMKSLTFPHFQWILAYQKPSFSMSFFIDFSCFSKTPPKEHF